MKNTFDLRGHVEQGRHPLGEHEFLSAEALHRAYHHWVAGRHGNGKSENESDRRDAAHDDGSRRKERVGVQSCVPSTGSSGRRNRTPLYSIECASVSTGCPVTARAQGESYLRRKGAILEAVCCKCRGLGHSKRECPSALRSRQLELAIESLPALKAERAPKKRSRRARPDTAKGYDGLHRQRRVSSVQL